MAEPFLAEIRVFAFGVVPQGWAQCNGQLLNITANQALYTLIGKQYGGDGVTTFALPNLQGRVPLPPGAADVVATSGGEAAHVLTISEMPAHTHDATAGADGTSNVAAGNVWGSLSTNIAYGDTANATMATAALSTAGASQLHPNMQPYLPLNFCIALQGIWPPKN